MIAIRPYILYSLPKSRTTQALTGKKIKKAFENVSSFLENCTTANSNKPNSLRLLAYTAFGKDESMDYSNKLIKDTNIKFGQGVLKPIGFMYPSGQPLEQKQIEWTLDPIDLNPAIEFLKQREPFQKFNLGPIELIISYDFKLVDLASNSEFPNQQYTSHILVWLSRSNCCNLTLSFPFESATKSFYEYLDKLTPLLPCKLELKYLRIGQANKQGTFNKFTKIK